MSAHLDDAAVSVGVTAQRLSLAHAVLVATVFTEHQEGPLSLSAQIFNTSESGSAAECMAARRAEDWDALALLGATPVHMGFVDATFRKDERGASRCERPEDILSADPRSDVAVIRAVARRLTTLIAAARPEIFLAPLGLGHHVDHKIVRIASDLATESDDSGRPRRAVAYYEDLPYAYAPNQASTPDLGDGWKGMVLRATDVQRERKLDAIRRYSTQLRFLGVSDLPWDQSLEEYGRRVGNGRLAERLWVKGDSRLLERLDGELK